MKLLLKLIACSLVFIVYSCSESSLVGEELLNESIPFNAVVNDTLTVKLSTVKQDKLRTDGLGNYLIGHIEDDPDFGNTWASVFTQVRLPSNNIDLVSSSSLVPVYDSLVLRLAYNLFYGDSTALQTIKVFELTENLTEACDTCYQYSSANYNSTPLAVLDNYQHQFSDSITLRRATAYNQKTDTFLVEQINTPTHLRLKLNNEFGERLFAQSGQTPFVDNDRFLEFFKGLHIEVDRNNSDKDLMISYALQTSNVSSLVLYYHTEGQDYIYGDTINGVVDSSLVTTYNHETLDFSINPFSKAFNRIINDYSGSNALAALNSNPDELGDDFAYIQAGGGVHIKVEFPYIKHQDFEKVLINKATLNLYPMPTANAMFNPPDLIFMYDADLYNRGFYTGDLIESGSLLYTDTATNQMRYSFNSLNNFNFSELIQNIIEGENSEEIILVPVNNSFTVNRAVIGGGNRTDDLKAELELIYTLTD